MQELQDDKTSTEYIAKKTNSKKNQKGKQRKGWSFPPPDLEEEESEEEEEPAPTGSKHPTQELEVQHKDTIALMDQKFQLIQTERNTDDMGSGGIK